MNSCKSKHIFININDTWNKIWLNSLLNSVFFFNLSMTSAAHNQIPDIAIIGETKRQAYKAS